MLHPPGLATFGFRVRYFSKEEEEARSPEGFTGFRVPGMFLSSWWADKERKREGTTEQKGSDHGQYDGKGEVEFFGDHRCRSNESDVHGRLEPGLDLVDLSF